ncbi:MAG: glycosyltransferase family 1 protein [Patescibacteria group bacterium]
MRIGIDARFYGTETGIGRYLERLIAELEVIDPVRGRPAEDTTTTALGPVRSSPPAGPYGRASAGATSNGMGQSASNGIDREREYVIFLRPENADRYTPKNPRFRKAIADLRWYTLREQALLPRILARERLDLMHFPHFNVPLGYRGAFVVTIHDLILLHYPSRRATTLGPLIFAAKYFGYKLVIGNAVRRARAVLTVSEYSRQEILRTFPVPADRVVVTPLAAGLPHNATAPRQIPPRPYVLAVGNSYPHKNLERMLRAFAALYKKTGEGYELVLAGPEDFFRKRLREEARALGIEAAIRFAGAVSDAELTGLYRNAALFVIPSLTEGFGMPPLEAMTAGVPVAAAAAGSLPEVLGDAATYFNPQDENDMRDALLRGLTDNSLRETLVARGFTQSATYSWRACAERTLAVYEKALTNASKNKK